MQKVITGQIVAADISSMGDKRYGYLGIETDDNEHIKIKVTAFTKYDTLDVGAKVKIVLESVGDEALLAAKNINNAISR
ncbi:hypothetical protein EU528_14715 [Candidatus Thorarchaeota archaeon]|nr:MAG: hypothetical protein EU528_14715 [Candidatus Thorarchaeota archaeon]